ncbi:MAG: HAMP domain-containing protein [Desulfonatronovibrio sp. MSAO_Bac4]|nr:MAG: HAMP domain-containing protein [Desulfonatronovibrio sp. MSAO_Bac4]
MLKSIRSKLLTIVALILLLTAVVIIYFTHRDVGREVMRIEQNNAENILDSAFLNIQGVYRGLISDRVASIEVAKERLKRESDFVSSMLDLYISDKGLIEDRDTELLQENFVNWLWNLDSGSTSFFVADKMRDVIFDTEMSLVERNLSDISDIKGVPLTEAINSTEYGSARFVVFSPADDQKAGDQRLGYLVFFPDWDWVFGASVDISYIKAVEERRLDELMNGLERQFDQMRIAQTGFLFMFDNKDNIVVSPETIFHADVLSQYFPELSASALNNEAITIVLDGQNIIAYTRYFRPLNWYLSALIPEAELDMPARNLVQSQSLIIGGIFFLGVLAAIFFVRHISGPLGVLTGQARKLASTEDPTSDDFDVNPLEKLTARYHDEVGALAGSFIFMRKELRKNVLKLLDATAAKERYESELNLAREIQMSMLPQKLPSFTGKVGVDLFAYLEPAREVGGDLYDYFMLDDDHLCFTVGDVSDKGMPASLYMAIARTLVQSHSAKEISPSTIMTRVNNGLSKDNPKSMFVTMIIAILNVKTGNVKYANAGHNLPIVIKNSGDCLFVKGISGPVAGAMEGIDYKELSVDLEPGEGLFLYTDGVTEAMNVRQELFSDERLLEQAEKIKDKNAENFVRDIGVDVVKFADGAPQSDDITMLMLRFNGPS